MYGQYARSLGPKILLTLLQIAGVCLSAWILFGSGSKLVLQLFFKPHPPPSDLTKALVLACAVFYFLRICFGAFYLVTRKLGWGETLGVGLYIVLIHVIFASFRATNSDQPAYLTVAGSALYIFGSYLNTGAELARHLWKHNPENAGRLYTGGLFRYSRHVNYFGDELLFTGYALISGSLWALLIPALMAVGFIFFNIPMLDRYLRQKYGPAFDAYALHTKKFIPFLY